MSKYVIYTCIVGGYDELLQPAVTDPDFDFVCFVGRGEKTADRIAMATKPTTTATKMMSRGSSAVVKTLMLRFSCTT